MVEFPEYTGVQQQEYELHAKPIEFKKAKKNMSKEKWNKVERVLPKQIRR